MSVSSATPQAIPDPAEPSARPLRSARDRGRAATRARLMEAGESLFAERGIHGVTSHDIAKRAGVAAGTFYLHFRDKAELFREIAQQAVADLRSRLERATASQPDTASAVRSHAAALVGFAEDNRDLIRILFSHDGEAAQVESDVLDQLAANIESSRKRRIESGDMPAEIDPGVMAQALVGMWARVVAWWAEDPTRAERDRVIDTLVRIQLSGTHPGH